MTINNHSGTDKGNELNNNKSIVETPKKKGDFKKKIERFGPLFLFLPIIILMTSDASLLLTNQVQLIIHFNIESGLAFTGIIIAGSLISRAIAMVVFGYWADKHSRKKALIIGGLLWVIGDLMTYLSINEYMLLFFRMMASAGTGVSAPVTMSLLSDIFSTEKRGKSFAYWGLATTVGELGGGSIGLLFNPLLDIEFPDHIVELPDKINFITLNFSETAINAWRIPFLFMFFIGIVFIILLFFVKEPKRGSRETILQSVLENEDIDYAKSYQIKKTDLKFIYTRKSNFWLIINFVDCIFSGLIMGFLITWLTLEIQL
ncbi:MAG: MFS transporter, partial [archaeon]|nr:MFS transporter [archaeon]